MSGGRARRRKQKAWLKNRKFANHSGICSNCGEQGPHFAPPGFGTPGFYVCKAAS